MRLLRSILAAAVGGAAVVALWMGADAHTTLDTDSGTFSPSGYASCDYDGRSEITHNSTQVFTKS